MTFDKIFTAFYALVRIGVFVAVEAKIGAFSYLLLFLKTSDSCNADNSDVIGYVIDRWKSQRNFQPEIRKILSWLQEELVSAANTHLPYKN
jgi:hypothetical protein